MSGQWNTNFQGPPTQKSFCTEEDQFEFVQDLENKIFTHVSWDCTVQRRPFWVDFVVFYQFWPMRERMRCAINFILFSGEKKSKNLLPSKISKFFFTMGLFSVEKEIFKNVYQFYTFLHPRKKNNSFFRQKNRLVFFKKKRSHRDQNFAGKVLVL